MTTKESTLAVGNILEDLLEQLTNMEKEMEQLEYNVELTKRLSLATSIPNVVSCGQQSEILDDTERHSYSSYQDEPKTPPLPPRAARNINGNVIGVLNDNVAKHSTATDVPITKPLGDDTHLNQNMLPILKRTPCGVQEITNPDVYSTDNCLALSEVNRSTVQNGELKQRYDERVLTQVIVHSVQGNGGLQKSNLHLVKAENLVHVDEVHDLTTIAVNNSKANTDVAIDNEQIFVCVFRHDKTSRGLRINKTTVVAECCQVLTAKYFLTPDVALSLVEKNPALKMERILEDHEFLADTVSNWPYKSTQCSMNHTPSENFIFFEERPDKYALLKDPTAWIQQIPYYSKPNIDITKNRERGLSCSNPLLSKPSSSRSSSVCSSNFRAVASENQLFNYMQKLGHVEDYLYVKDGKGLWNKKLCVMDMTRNNDDGDGLFLSLKCSRLKRNSKSSALLVNNQLHNDHTNKNELGKVCLPALGKAVVLFKPGLHLYVTSGGWTKDRAPTPFGFAFKPTEITSKYCEHYSSVVFLCACTDVSYRRWISVIRLKMFKQHFWKNYYNALLRTGSPVPMMGFLLNDVLAKSQDMQAGKIAQKNNVLQKKHVVGGGFPTSKGDDETVVMETSVLQSPPAQHSSNTNSHPITAIIPYGNQPFMLLTPDSFPVATDKQHCRTVGSAQNNTVITSINCPTTSSNSIESLSVNSVVTRTTASVKQKVMLAIDCDGKSMILNKQRKVINNNDLLN